VEDPRRDPADGVVNRVDLARAIDSEGQVVHRARSAAADRIEGVLRALGYDSQGERRMVVLDEPVVPVPDDGAPPERASATPAISAVSELAGHILRKFRRAFSVSPIFLCLIEK